MWTVIGQSIIPSNENTPIPLYNRSFTNYCEQSAIFHENALSLWHEAVSSCSLSFFFHKWILCRTREGMYVHSKMAEQVFV